MKPIFAAAIATFTFGCVQTIDERNPTVPTPDPMVIAGEVEAGMATAAKLRSQGFNVVTAFNGRADGIAAFCTSRVDAMVIQDVTSEEHQRCRDLRDGASWGWSAMSGENGAGLYIRRGYADDYLARLAKAREQ